jgi:hypothetical protein
MADPSQVISIDAPIGGWNAFDSMDNMPPDCAVILDNLVPEAGSVNTRGGTISYADLETGLPVETVASLDTDETSLLVAASNGGIWTLGDSPEEAATEAIENVAPELTYANNKWQTANFRKADEEGILIMCNGVDEVQILSKGIVPFYTTIIDAIFDYGAFTPPDSPFIGCLKFKGRMYYWADNDDAFWYTQAGSYQGTMQKFDLGAIAQKGGYIKFICTWTQQDSGDGKDDFLVFVMSTGEVVIYQGDDPETVGFFEMVGRYTTARPLSIRGWSQYGADTIIMTDDGYVALSTIVQQGRISDVPAFSRLITTAITNRTLYGSNWYGWDVTLSPKSGLFIFNVPLGDGTQQFVQHTLNTVTMKWCRFTGINVNCIESHRDRVFGGTFDGHVIGVYEGTSDLGSEITFTALPAFNYLGDPGNNKHITAAQVITTHSNPELINLSAHADFNWIEPDNVSIPSPKNSATWSIIPAIPFQTIGSFWDEDYWAVQNAPTTKGWQNVSGYGYAVTVMVRFKKVNEGVTWRSTGIRFNRAGAQ